MNRMTYLVMAAAVLAVDQITKAVIVSRFSADAIVPVIPGLFRLVHVENRGIAFGIFSDSSSPAAGIILVLVSLAAIVLIGVLLWRNHPAAKITGVGLALILGGAAGNLLDRLLRGQVVDFLDVYLASYHWPAFNIADSAISIGAATLLWDLLIAQPARHREA
jgi:signal peptidase II